MTKFSGYINSIETMGLVDGPGIRVVFFMQGCPLRCLYCHNPETWGMKSDLIMTPKEVVEKILRFKNYFGKEGGVTFSGGEPLLQKDFLLETLKLCKKEGINTAIDTCGVTDDDYDEILDYVDLVIMDIKSHDRKEYKHITGVEIEKSLEFLECCQSKNKKMWIRRVVVPNINDTEKQTLEFKNFISKIKNVEKVELLPYQTLGVHKYKELSLPYKLEDVESMDKEKCERLSKLLT